MSEPIPIDGGSSRRPLPVQLQVEHPPAVKEAAFVAWLAADRNAARAVKLLDEFWPESEPRRPVPYRTLAGWARRDNWDSKADAAIAEALPHLTTRHAARLVHMAGLALTALEEVISGDGFARDAEGNILFDRNGEALIIDPRHQRNRLDGAVKALELSGTGTAGSRDRRPPVVRAVVAETPDFSGMGLEELIRWEQELLRQSRTDLPEQRR